MADEFADSGQSGAEIIKNSLDQVAVERVSVVGSVDPVPAAEGPAEPGHAVDFKEAVTESLRESLAASRNNIKLYIFGRLRQFRSADDTPAGEWKRALSDAKLLEVADFLVDVEYKL